MVEGAGRSLTVLAAGVSVLVVLTAVAAGATVLAAPVSSLHAAGDAIGWPTDRGDAARTGSTAGHGPAGPYATVDWRTNPDGRPTGVAVANGTAFLGLTTYHGTYRQSGAVYAYDTSNGEERWNRSDLAAVEGTPAVSDGRVFVTATLDDDETTSPDSGRGGLFALDASTGETVWSNNETLRWTDGGSPTVVDGTLYAASGAPDNTVYAFDAATGAERWRYQTAASDERATENQGFAVINGTVVVTYGENVTAIDAATGERRWSVSLSSADGGLSSPAVAGGAVYVTAEPDRVYRLSTDGEVEWTVRVDNSLNRSVPDRISAPAVDDGAVFVATDDDYSATSADGQDVGTVHRLDAASGAEEWRFETAADVESAPSVTDRAVYVAGEYNSTTSDLQNAPVVYALNRSDGTERWSYALQETFDDDRFDAVVPADDRLFVVAHARGFATYDGFLRVLRGSEDPPAPSHTVAEDQPEERPRPPLVELTTDPTDAEDQDLDAGQNVTLTANATDLDGTVTAIEWDVDEDGEYDRSGETITLQLNYCGSLEVTVRVTDDDGLSTTESVGLGTA